MARMLVLICLALVTGSSLAAAEPRLVAQKILGVYNGDGTGAYEQVYAALQKQAGGVLPKPDVIDAGEAIDAYEAGKVDCMTPANSNRDFYPVDFPTVQSQAFNVAKIYIFSAPGRPPFLSLDELQGKTVGVRDGFSYGARVDAAKLKLVTSLTIEANIAKLIKGRIDAIIDFVPDAWEAFANFGMPPLPHQADKPVAVHQDAVVCRDTPETRDLIALIDRGIERLKADSTLKTLLGSSYSPD